MLRCVCDYVCVDVCVRWGGVGSGGGVTKQAKSTQTTTSGFALSDVFNAAHSPGQLGFALSNVFNAAHSQYTQALSTGTWEAGPSPQRMGSDFIVTPAIGSTFCRCKIVPWYMLATMLLHFT